MAEGFSDNRREPTDALTGEELTLHYENGREVTYEFVDEDTLNREVVTGDGAGETFEDGYYAVQVRDGTFYVDFVDSSKERTARTIVLDRDRGIATVVVATLSTEEEASKPPWRRALDRESLSAVNAQFLSASIDSPFTSETDRHERTDELVGKRVQYAYTSDALIEHVYLNENRFTWHALTGPFEDEADTEETHVFKLDDELYLFVWLEKVLQTIGTDVIDLQKMQSTGKLFGCEPDDFSNISNPQMAADATLLNETEYDR